MSSQKLSSSQSIPTEKIVRECVHTIGQIIYQNRIPQLKAGEKTSTWFNLRLNIVSAVREKINGALPTTGQPININIDILLSAPSISKILLERWSLHYEITDPSLKKDVDQSNMYKRMIILIRSLSSKIHFLPAQPLYKAAQFSDDRKFSLDAETSAPNRDAPSFDSPPLNFVFSPVNTPGGKLHFSVFYRKDCSFEFTQPKPVQYEKIIHDYAGSKPSTPTSLSRSLPALEEKAELPASAPSSGTTPTIHTPTQTTTHRFRRVKSDAGYSDSIRRLSLHRNSLSGKTSLETIPDEESRSGGSRPIPIHPDISKRSSEDASVPQTFKTTPPFAGSFSSSPSGSLYTPQMTPPQFGVSNGVLPSSERRGSESRESSPFVAAAHGSLPKSIPKLFLQSPGFTGSHSPGAPPFLNLSSSRGKGSTTEASLAVAGTSSHVRGHIPRAKTWTPSSHTYLISDPDPDFVSSHPSHDSESAVGSFLKGINELPQLQMFSQDLMKSSSSSSSVSLSTLLAQLDHFAEVSRNLSQRHSSEVSYS